MPKATDASYKVATERIKNKPRETFDSVMQKLNKNHLQMTELDNKSNSITWQRAKLKSQNEKMIKSSTQTLTAKRVSFMVNW